MEYRNIGESPLRLSAICFGAWAAGGWMWGGNDRQEAVEAIVASIHEGVTSIDTAPVYGQGASEEIVGEAIRHFPREKVQVLTKFGMRWDLTKGTLAMSSKDNDGRPIDIYKYAGRESIIRECEDSLRRLRTDYIDLYQIHWPDVTTPIEESMEAVDQLIRQGKVRYAGVCNYDVQQVAKAILHVALVSNQVPYSMVRRDIENELVPYCITNRISILAYSPLQRGLLTGKMKTGQSFGEGDSRKGLHYFSNENIGRVNTFLEKLKPICREKDATASQLVLRWTLDQPGITIALAGARNARQAVANARAGGIKLTREDHQFIREELSSLAMEPAGS